MEMYMNIEGRKASIDQKLESIGETVVSWSKKNSLDHRLVFDLINGKLLGTRGVSLEARTKIEEFFGKVFDN
jgi:hypothetical protein